MKLMRNVTPDGQCKYAAIRMDKLAALPSDQQHDALTALMLLNGMDLLENPRPGEREEFFLIKLKDRHSAAALYAYETSIWPTDPEFAQEVHQLAARAGERSPWCKEPDTAYGVPVVDAAQRIADLEEEVADVRRWYGDRLEILSAWAREHLEGEQLDTFFNIAANASPHHTDRPEWFRAVIAKLSEQKRAAGVAVAEPSRKE